MGPLCPRGRRVLGDAARGKRGTAPANAAYAARIERFRRLYASAGHDADPELAARTALAYRQLYIASRREVGGASALLRALRQHARVAVVSNNLLFE